MVDGSRRHPSANALDAACTKQAEAMGFASIITVGREASVKGKKCCYHRKGKKRAGVSAASGGMDAQLYTPVKLPSSREAHLKAMVISLEALITILPSPLYADPMLPLAATLAIFKATLDSPSIAVKDKGQVTQAGD